MEPMNCPHCDRNIPADAAFCIYCAAPVKLAPGIPQQPPATGATIRLDPAQAPTTPRRDRQRRARQVPQVPLGRQSVHRKRKRTSDPSGLFFVLGFFFLITSSYFWPGILVLIGLTKFIKRQSRGASWRAARDLFFWGGLAFLFWTQTFWPGILLLLLATSLLGNRRHAWGP